MTLPDHEHEKFPFNLEEYTLEEILKPSRCALLVVDMQNDFLHPEGKFAKWKRPIDQMQSIVPQIQRLIDQAHTAQVPVIFTLGHEDVRFRKGPDLRRAAKWKEDDSDPTSVNSLSGTFGADFYTIKPQDGKDIVIEKHKWSAFAGKDPQGRSLKEILDHLQISTLVVAGVVAETCIETTVRDAYNQDYFIVIPENSIGSNNPNQLKARMDYWKGGHIGDVVQEEEIIQNWPNKTQTQEAP